MSVFSRARVGFLSQMKTVAGTDLLNVRDRALLQTTGLTDMVLLYFTLLADKAVPNGFLPEFVNLENSMRRSSERSVKLAASLSDADAERLLGIDKERKFQDSLSSSSAADQLMIAADIKPRRFQTKWEQACYEGPTARHDAETAERSRWITLLADLLRNTDTPMERLLRENPDNSQLLGSGQRAGTLRSRVRIIQFIAWLTTAHSRLSEPCVRGFQEVAGIQDKFTDDALYDVTWKELLASALPVKRPPWQARFPTIILAALEDSVVSLDTPTCWRVMSWWLLLQCWATLRYDHRGIVPSELKVSESGPLRKLTRSKVSGPDKKFNFRLLVVHSSAYVHQTLVVDGVAAAGKR